MAKESTKTFMSQPSIAFVFSLEGEVLGPELSQELLKYGKFDYINHVDNASGLISSQLRIWEGLYSEFRELDVSLTLTIERISEFSAVFGRRKHESAWEIAVFTQADNQELRVPNRMVLAIGKSGFPLHLTFFHSSD